MDAIEFCQKYPDYLNKIRRVVIPEFFPITDDISQIHPHDIPRPDTWFPFESAAMCFAGGAVIGFGSQLIIGSHDSITLYGFPLLLTSSILAMLLNLATIAF